MKKLDIEYATHNCPISQIKEVKAILADYLKDGWECISVAHQSAQSVNDYVVIYFKRTKIVPKQKINLFKSKILS